MVSQVAVGGMLLLWADEGNPPEPLRPIAAVSTEVRSTLISPKNVIAKVWTAFDGLANDTIWSAAKDILLMVNAYASAQFLQLTFEKEVLGNYFGIFGVIGVLGAFVHSGVGMAALQRILGERDDPRRTINSYVSWGLILSIAAVILTLIAAGLRLKQLGIVEILALAAAELVVIGIVVVVTSSIQGILGFPAAARLRMGVIAIRFTITTSLFLFGGLNVRNLAFGFLAGFVVYAAWILKVYLPHHGLGYKFVTPTKMQLTSGLTFSSPMAAGKVQTDGDKYLLPSFGFETEAASYGIAYRGMQVANAPLMALESAAFQRFLPKGEGQKDFHMRKANRFTWLMFGSGLVLAIVMFLAMPILEFLLFRGNTRDAADILPWLLGLIPVMALSGTPLNGMIGLGRAKERAYIFAISAAVSLALYLPLISRYDWRGAVVATYISETFLIVVGWWALWHYQQVENRRIDEEEEEGSSVESSADVVASEG